MRKQVITPGQAILILIDQVSRSAGSNQERLEMLKKLYLCGVSAGSDFMRYMAETYDLLETYTISIEYEDITKDPSRRYFESLLAYYTLHSTIGCLDRQVLIDHVADMALHAKIKAIQKTCEDSSTYRTFMTHKDNEKKGWIRAFSAPDKFKLSLLYQLFFIVPYLIGEEKALLPSDIYGEGYFSEKSRGRVEKETRNAGVHSSHLGLLQSTSPLPYYKNICRSKIPVNYVRIADRNTYRSKAQWVKDNFIYYVHPFGSSISGTMLLQMRFLAYQMKKKRIYYLDAAELKGFVRCLISLALFNSGGHTLHEYCAVFGIEAIKQALHDKYDLSEFNEYGLFLKENEKAFEATLKQTLEYNRILVTKGAALFQINNKESKLLDPQYKAC